MTEDKFNEATEISYKIDACKKLEEDITNTLKEVYSWAKVGGINRFLPTFSRTIGEEESMRILNNFLNELLSETSKVLKNYQETFNSL